MPRRGQRWRLPGATDALASWLLAIASIALGWLLDFAAAVLLGLPAIILGGITPRRTRQGMTAARRHALTGIVTAVAAPFVLSLIIGPEL